MNPMGGVAGFFLLVVRGVLLWIVVPVSFIAWLLVFSWLCRTGPGPFIGWLDLNLVAALQRSMFRPWVPVPSVDFVHVSGVGGVRHRVSLLFDLV